MDHPGLLHLHVHLMEMSPYPEVALVTGDRLRELSPDMGHLTHMPTHIDIQCGHYRDAMHWNQKAIIADRKFYDRAGPMNFYSGYRIHNYHFAAYGAMFLGQYAPAIAAADELIETMPEAMLRIPSPPMADFFESYVSIRAARADPLRQVARDHRAGAAGGSGAVLQHCGDDALCEGCGTRGAWRGGKRRRPSRRCSALRRNGFPRRGYCTTCHACNCWGWPRRCWHGEIDYRRGEYDTAFAHLRAAVALEDALPYDEPWGWMQPVRHALGALLLEQGRVAEAEAVYREDLGLGGASPRAQIHPDNRVGAARAARLPRAAW